MRVRVVLTFDVGPEYEPDAPTRKEAAERLLGEMHDAASYHADMVHGLSIVRLQGAGVDWRP